MQDRIWCMSFQGEFQSSCPGHSMNIKIDISQEPTMCMVTKLGLCDKRKEPKWKAHVTEKLGTSAQLGPDAEKTSLGIWHHLSVLFVSELASSSAKLSSRVANGH